ncbi:hypothetical protein BUALT_Bualt03G0136200 [Buddleja alternifolia]|uniref:Dynein light chain n=1 Tax=Buddleja alternifolia TaxID=168488 RepID=A0AAV6XXS7_9LAMI|nr:hypothetical protein BUALT_Bualt03G0136200 [Buddleja alternifolia]
MDQNHSKNKHLTNIPSRRKALTLLPKNTTQNNHSTRSLQQQQEEEVKLAALAISFNIRLRSADMPSAMQERALRHARALLDSAADHRRPNPTLLARSLKKVNTHTHTYIYILEFFYVENLIISLIVGC